MKKKVFNRSSYELEKYRSLLAALSDDLSLPLLQIKTTLEVVENNPAENLKDHMQTLALSAEAGLNLVEAYRLALRHSTHDKLLMEPVSIGAVLQETAHELTPYARQYAVELQVDVQGKLTPVLAHKPSLVAALECLGASMIRAQAAAVGQKRSYMLFGAHKSSNDLIAAGVFSNVQGLSDKTLKTAHNLVGKAHQPLPNIPPGSASGILIADMLCTSMWQPLRSAAHRKMGGLATTVPISQQMQFV